MLKKVWILLLTLSLTLGTVIASEYHERRINITVHLSKNYHKKEHHNKKHRKIRHLKNKIHHKHHAEKQLPKKENKNTEKNKHTNDKTSNKSLQNNKNQNLIKKTFTFKELNLLSTDLLLKGINPRYDFYIPAFPQLEKGDIKLILQVSPYLKKNSTVSIFVNDLPYKTYNVDNLPPEIDIPFKRNGNKNFVKITLSGSLRISHDICADIFSDNIWMLVKRDSKVEFDYRPFSDIREFLMDYNNRYCINSVELVPFVYYMCKDDPVPCDVSYYTPQKNSCKLITASKGGVLNLSNNVLYVPLKAINAFESGVFPDFLINSYQDIRAVNTNKEVSNNSITLKALGLNTATVEGVGNLNYTIPLDMSKIGGIPKDLHLYLHISHTPVHKKDSMELRVYLNGNMITAYPLKGSGEKSFRISIPSDSLVYGTNYIGINLVDLISSDSCFGAITHVAFTVFGDSYFYWDALENNPKTISDFIKILHGSVAVLVKDPEFYDLATKFVSFLGVNDKNIDTIAINPEHISKYDYIIAFKNPKDTRDNVVDLSEGDFKIVNPLNKKVIFTSTFEKPFSVIMVQRMDGKPALIFSYYKDPEGIQTLYKHDFKDLLKLYGNIGISTDRYIASYEVGKKLRVEYLHKKGISYYWDKYKIWILLFFVVPVTAFLLYVYKRLTRRSL